MKTAASAVALALAVATLTTCAQSAGGLATTGGGTAGQGQRQRPSPAQIAAHVMQKFDANKDGKLAQGELTKALEALRQHRRQGAGGAAAGGQHGQAGSGAQARPSPEKIAAHIIAKFAADKHGLTQAELVQALEAHRAQHSQHGGGTQPASAGHANSTSSGTSI